jgi:hypothetical protein
LEALNKRRFLGAFGPMINFKRARAYKSVQNAKLRFARVISIKLSSSAKLALMPIISPLWSIGKLEFSSDEVKYRPNYRKPHEIHENFSVSQKETSFNSTKSVTRRINSSPVFVAV